MNNKKNMGIEIPPEGGKEEMDRKLVPYVREIVDTFKKIARNEYKNPGMILNDIKEQLSLLNSTEIESVRDAVKEELESIYASNTGNKFSENLKKEVTNWSDRLFGNSIRLEDLNRVSRGEAILDDVATRIADAINSDFVSNFSSVIKFTPLFNELRSGILRGNSGDYSYVSMLKELPVLVEEKIRKRYYDSRVEKVRPILKKLKKEVEDAIKEETGFHNI